MPGGLGTVGLAGHRDTFFRPLRAVKPAIEVHLTDAKGTYRYTVDATEIVSPDRVDVLNASAQPGLTLVTCYPFDYVGAAPKRFIVHARLISVVPEHILSW
jgi:sortase A